MQYNRFGRTGLLVSELCLGTMTFGGEGYFKVVGEVQQTEANAIVKAALDSGINFLDTANVYSNGLSEAITGKALRDLGIRRQDVVIATKALGPMGDGPNDRGTSRYHLMAQIDASLKRMELDHVDLYQIHGWDPLTPVEECLRALDDIVRSGRARYVGVSNWAAWQIMKALGISERLGLHRFESLQAYYTVAGRDLEREIVPLLVSEQLGLMVWSPLAGGLLSGKYTRDNVQAGAGRRANFDFPPVDKERAFDLIDAMRPMAELRGVSVARIALAWLLHQSVVSSVIIGAKRVEQVLDNVGASEVKLDPHELDQLDRLSALAPEYPGWMIERQATYRSGNVAGSPPAPSKR